MDVKYRPLTAEDLEQAAYLEAVAFYGKPTPERAELLRKFFPPDWTVGAFLDGRLVADVRTIPMARRINGKAVPFGAVGPVACLAGYRRQGHIGKLLRLALERMREGGQPLSGLHTPHDALYVRYGWERAEAKKRYEFRPRDIRMRLKGSPGTLESVIPDEWQRLDAIYRTYAEPRNGPLHRVEPWWREAVLRHWEESGERPENDAFVWRNSEGRDQGYAVYFHRPLPRTGPFVPWEVVVRDLVSLSGDAYLGLWQHLLTHDLATQLAVEVPTADPFDNLAEDPWKITVTKAEGAMIRIVDVERALSMRPCCGSGSVSFTMHISDTSAPWNEATWRLQAFDGHTSAEKTDSDADVELSANTLSPLFTGHLRPDVAAGAGLLKINRPEVIAEMTEAFAVTYPPYGNDFY